VTSLIHANGVNGLTGEYLLAPVAPSDVAARAGREPADREVSGWLADVGRAAGRPTFGLPFDVRPEDVTEAGWAIVFGRHESDAVRLALEPLIEHRRRQIGDKVKVLDHLPGESWQRWLARHGAGPGTVDPRKVPYYVLLVGGPQSIPFSFQYLLDVEYAVGRLDLDVEGYQRYVRALIEYERAATAPHRRAAAFFGTRHPFDEATRLSADRLVGPLAGSFGPGGRFERTGAGHQIHTFVGPAATKEAFGEILTGAPAVLFSATHGLGGWPAGHPDQAGRHGALVCQDWPGLGQIAAGHYFSAADVPADARVHGLVAFLFACYGAGTPRWDMFRHVPGTPPPVVADEPFVAALPKALLAHPEGGALAVIGHVERAWGYSFVSDGGTQLLPFQNALGRILAGQPVGFAMKDFNEKYAALSANLSDVLERQGFGIAVSDRMLAGLWTERNDAQNYVVLGDPAVHLKAG
jgi:hypothetical protein